MAIIRYQIFPDGNIPFRLGRSEDKTDDFFESFNTEYRAIKLEANGLVFETPQHLRLIEDAIKKDGFCPISCVNVYKDTLFVNIECAEDEEISDEETPERGEYMFSYGGHYRDGKLDLTVVGLVDGKETERYRFVIGQQRDVLYIYVSNRLTNFRHIKKILEFHCDEDEDEYIVIEELV